MEHRHRALYEYLLDKGDVWTPQHEVASDLYEYFGNGECYFELKAYHDTHERCLLSKTISEINETMEYEKIIISSSKGIKLANEEEFERYIKNLYRSVFKKLKRVRTMERKCNLHNQITIDGHTIDAFLEKFPETT